MPTILNILFALFLPSNVNSIEPTVDVKPIKEVKNVLLRKAGKQDKKICTFSVCGEEGFEENVLIHNAQIEIGISKRITPTIDNELLRFLERVSFFIWMFCKFRMISVFNETKICSSQLLCHPFFFAHQNPNVSSCCVANNGA